MHMPISSPGLSDYGPDRCKQINTLLIFNENVSTIQQDVHYRVDFMSNGKPLSLSIHLPPDYPNVRPNVYVEPRGIVHPWIREDGAVVGAPGLILYAKQTDLGRLVQAIKRELERNPPTFLNNNSSSSFGRQGLNGFNGLSTYQTTFSQGMPIRGGAPQQSPYCTSMQSQKSDWKVEELQSLSYDQLNELNSTPAALQHFMRSLKKPVAPIDQSLTQLRNYIREADTSIRQLEAECQSKRDQLLSEVDHFHAAKERLKRSVDEIKEYRSRYSERNLTELMQKASIADEEKSEACAESFLGGVVGADQFLSEYLQVRTDHHKKRVTADRRVKFQRET